MSMKKNLVPFFSRIYGPAFSPQTLAVWISAIVIAVVAGPFGTFEAMSPLKRALYWGAVVSASVFFGYTVRAVAHAVVGPGRPALFDAFGVTIMTLVFAPVVWVMARVAGGGAGRTPPSLAQVFFYVFLVTGVICVVRRLIPGIEPETYRFLSPEPPGGTPPDDPPVDMPAPAEAVPQEAAALARPRIMRRLPPGARGRILRLAASDHQVEVVTQTEVISLRMRLKDAIYEMEPVQGYRIHRSHWVARDAVVRFRRNGPQKLVAELTNGDRVPVSRKYRTNLENAGIIKTPERDG